MYSGYVIDRTELQSFVTFIVAENKENLIAKY